ncbi:MAG TPA: LacI family transcriptional regulator [Clostridiaceae bacterium]|nr:LacI family transcriptional regulator [Clostridiaceae bacterium]
MRVNIKQVAEAAKVSTATVSHVINNTRYVSEETRNRVLAALKELNYRPSNIARSLRTQETKTIGLLMPIMVYSSFDYYFMLVAHGIRSTLKEKGYSLILGSSGNSKECEIEQIESFITQRIDGLIILPTESDSDYLSNTLKGNFPVVFIDRRAKGCKGDCVLADNFQGSYDAVTALINKGHRKIGFITNNLKATTIEERITGYKKALTDHGIKVDESLMRFGDYTYETGYMLMKDLLEKEKEITAVFIADNLLTMGSLEYLYEINKKIPEEIAIISFDDFEWERIITPPLSVVKQPPFEIGQKAAEVLLERLSNPDKPYTEYRLPTELVVRKSF